MPLHQCQDQVDSQLDVKLEQFTEKELDTVLKKAEKLQVSMKYFLKHGKPENLSTYYFDDAALCINKTIEKRKKGYILVFFRKSDHGITKNYNCITLTAIAAKVYNVLLLNGIQSKVEKILRENYRFSVKSIHNLKHSDYPSNYRTCTSKKSRETFFWDFSEAFDPMHRGKIKQLQLT